MIIRGVKISDAEAICNIYNHYIRNTVITFEEEALDVTEIEKRISEITKKYPWIVCEENNVVLGYAYANMWKARSAFRHSVECAVYVDSASLKKQIGSQLYNSLIPDLENKYNAHSIIAGIALPNEPSVALHEKFKFKKCGHFHEVGYKFNQWVDVGYWERIFK